MHTLMALWVCLQDGIVESSHAVTFSLSVICVEAQCMKHSQCLLLQANYSLLQVENA